MKPHLNEMRKFAKLAIKGEVDIKDFREAAAARGVIGKSLNYYEGYKDWIKQSGLPQQETNPDGTIKKNGLNLIDTKTKEGEARYLNSLNDFSKILDNRFTGLTLFTSTMTHGGTIIFESAPLRIDSTGKQVKSSQGSSDAVKNSLQKTNVKDFNADITLAKSVDKKMAEVEALVVKTLNDPKFDKNNPK